MTGNPRYHVREDVQVTSPVLVVTLTGWIDASQSAAGAIAALEEQCHARTIVTFDRDTFIDFRSRRPTMEIRDGHNSRLVWPDTELKVGQDASGRDVLFLSGIEPDSCWMAFAEAVTELAVRYGVSQMVGLGAYPYNTPHTRPSRLSCTTPDVDLLPRLPFLQNSVDVPCGMEAVLEHALHDHSIPAYGLWVQVPHYVSAMSYPAASVALVEGLCQVTGLSITCNGLRGEALLQRTRLDDLVSKNEEHKTMVRQMEQVYDAHADDDFDDGGNGEAEAPYAGDDLGSGDDLVKEVEEFLRDQG